MLLLLLLLLLLLSTILLSFCALPSSFLILLPHFSCARPASPSLPPSFAPPPLSRSLLHWLVARDTFIRARLCGERGQIAQVDHRPYQIPPEHNRAHSVSRSQVLGRRTYSIWLGVPTSDCKLTGGGPNPHTNNRYLCRTVQGDGKGCARSNNISLRSSSSSPPLPSSSHETRVFVCSIEWRSLPVSTSGFLPLSSALLLNWLHCFHYPPFSLSPARRTTRRTVAQPSPPSHFMNRRADARKLHLTMCEERGI